MKLLRNSLSTIAYLSILFPSHAIAFEVVKANNISQKDIILNNFSFSAFGQQSLYKSNASANTKVVKFDNKRYDIELFNLGVDKANNLHFRYRQKYKGIPVYGRQLIQHQDIKNTNMFKSSMFNNSGVDIKYTGELINGLDVDLSNQQIALGFDEKAALELAQKLNLDNIAGQRAIDKDNNNLIYENQKSELIIYTYNTAANQATLAYKVSFFVDDANGNYPMRPYYIIDATNKQVIKSWNALSHGRVATGPGGNEKIGKYLYGEDMPMLDVREARKGGECFMVSDKVRTVNLNNGYYGIKTYHFPCYESNNDAINGSYSPLNDAHYYGEQVYNMYDEWYGISPLDFKLVMRVHYGNKYENAFWNGSSMTFGDGKKRFYPLVSMDVVAHEVSHGFTEHNSGLEYMAQAGALNESYSDMAGKAGEFFTFGKNTWNIGDDISKNDKPIRYMDNPEKDGDSIADARDYDESLDVHNSSGVFNKAFYLLSTTDHWNIKKAFDIFMHANRYYWVETTDYLSGALGAVYSAEDLGLDTNDVITAFNKVGIDCTLKTCTLMPKEDSNNSSDSDDSTSVSDDESSSSSSDADAGTQTGGVVF